MAATTALAVAGLVLCGTAVAAAPVSGADSVAVPAGDATGLSPQLETLIASGANPATEAAATALSVAPTGAGSLQTDADDRIGVTVTFASTPDASQLDALAGFGDITAVSPLLPKVSLFVPAGSLPALAAVEGVWSVVADLAPSVAGAPPASAAVASAPAAPAPSCRSIPVDVDPGLKSDQARARFGVDGTGVTVGIVSTSFDSNPGAATRAADDVAAGLLPGPGNPCGYTTPVQMVGAAEPVSSDEGRGMAQMVHGVAPGATLAFSSGVLSTTAFSAAVVALTDAGADIIVDDLSFPTEPMFQDGELSIAIDYATSRGVLYVSAAGNYNEFSKVGDDFYAIGGWETTTYSPTECPAYVVAHYEPTVVDCHDFGAPGAPQPAMQFTGQNGEGDAFGVTLNWTEPAHHVTAGFVPAVGSLDGSSGLVGTTVDPALPVGLVSVDLEGTTPATDTYALTVVRERPGTSTAPLGFKMIFPEDEAGTVSELAYYENTDTVTVGASIYGHTADADVLSVGAAPWQNPTENDAFSSVGPVRHLFGPVRADSTPAAPLAAPETRSKPELTSLDGAQTSFFSPPATPEGYLFFGTSAASPNAAGVAALALQHSPQSSPDAVKNAMTSTATTMVNPFVNATDAHVFGAGLLDAEATLAALPAAPAPAPTPAPGPTVAPTPVSTPAALAATGDPATDAVHLLLISVAVLGLGIAGLIGAAGRVVRAPRR